MSVSIFGNSAFLTIFSDKTEDMLFPLLKQIYFSAEKKGKIAFADTSDFQGKSKNGDYRVGDHIYH